MPLIGEANFQLIRIPTQIWAVSRHQYGIFAVVPQTQFHGEISSGAAKILFAFSGYVQSIDFKIASDIPFMFDQIFLFCLGFCYVGDPESFVMGHIINGQFDGSFVVFGETFHLEPVQRYDIGLNASFHSIVFSSSSVKFDFSRIQRTMARFADLYHHVAVKVNDSKNVFVKNL